ncbi:tyrosine-protein phosphatase [Agaribacter marinus]|uniref:protein-tyrosine-phosphatase n=1 Tax=Agaribacter marinus TaxID=1431249 RepID=A0AA37WK15_9ALTE|nr:CpsB/CapC family capsule biosynthesis tyrosine phosphatase [Agaribacter marinus]GLR72872.1 tyrosine protein phosphatase [Agaribacter marinus]
MIDLHSHILPGIDDGAKTLQDSIEMAKYSIERGVTHMMCTPHIHFNRFNNTYDSIAHIFFQMLEAVAEQGLALKLAFGAEVRVAPEIISLVKSNTLPYIGEINGKSCVLLELPHSHVPAGADTLIKWLIANEVQPIIPHPERNREILDDYNKVLWLKKLGCLFQLTAGAVVGKFGQDIQLLSGRMLDDSLPYYVASDMHNLDKRANDMSDAYDYVESEYGTSHAESLFITNPKTITARVDWQ